MRRSLRPLIAVSALACLLASVLASPATASTVSEISAAGVVNPVVSAVNNSGQVAGTAGFAGVSGPRAFRWQNGAFTNLGILSGPDEAMDPEQSRGSDINNSGQVLGQSSTDDVCFGNYYGPRAVLWTGTSAEGLDGLSQRSYGPGLCTPKYSLGLQLGESDYLAGQSTLYCPSPDPQFSGTNTPRAYVAQGSGTATATGPACTGTASDFGTETTPVGLNAAKTVMVALGNGTTDQLITASNQQTDLPIVSGNPTLQPLHALNDAGVAVGLSKTADHHAVRVENGVGQPLTPPSGYPNTFAGSIDNRDQAVGFATDNGSGAAQISIAVRWTGTTPTDLNTLLPPGSGWHLSDAYDISSDGTKIIGRGTKDGVATNFLLDVGGLVVNDTGDGGDASPGDGACLDDHGRCTLRAAIQEANAQAPSSPVDITFDIPGGGVPRITPGSALPAITAPVNLDASTQPGTGRERVALGSSTGHLAFRGLDLEGGDSTVKGFAVAGFSGAGITVGGTSQRAGLYSQLVQQCAVARNDVGIEVAAAAVTVDGVGVFGNGNLDAANAFEAGLKGRKATPADEQQQLIATGAGILVRKQAASGFRVQNSVIGGLPAADGPGPAGLNQAIGILLAPTDGALYGAVIGAPSTPNKILGNAIGIAYAAPGAKVGTSSISGNGFGDDPAGRSRMAPFSNGIGVLLSGNVDHASVERNSFRDGVLGILAAGGGVTGLQVKGNDLGPNKNLADLAAQIKGGHPSLGDHNLFGLLMADVQGAVVTGNHVFGDALGILMAGQNSRFNVLTSNQVGLTGRPAGRRNATTVGDFGSAVGIVAAGGEKNTIGAPGAGNDVAASLGDTIVANEHADTIQGNFFRDGLYGLVLGGVGGNTSVGGRTAGDGNTIARNWLGVVQADHELTPAEQKVQKLDKAPADASDRQLAFDTPYSAAPLNLASALSTADVSKDVVAFNPENAAQSASVRYGHNLIGTNSGGGRFGNFVGMWLGGDVRKTLIGVGGGGPNVIGNNHQAGIVMFGHSGHWPMGVSVLGNSIYDNSSLSSPDPLIPGAAGLGIDLTTPIATPTFASQVFGPTPNDPGDGDQGPNGLQNYPVLSEAARAPGYSYRGTLESTPNRRLLIEVASSPFCNPFGFGEGEHVLRSFEARTDESGVAAFAFEEEPVHGRAFHSRLPGHDRYLTATATAPDGSTSEYSACARVTGDAPALSVAPGDTGVSPDGVTSVEVFNAAAYDVEEISIKYDHEPINKPRSATGARSKRRAIVLAHAKVHVRKHHHKRVRLRLTRSARKLLAQKHTLKVTVTVTSHRAKRRYTATARYVLHAPAPKHTKKKPKR